MWIAYDRLSPIGDWRGDVQAAQVATAAINAQGGKLGLNDVLLKWGQSSEESEISDLEEWMSSI
jgi:hypothetical protein